MLKIDDYPVSPRTLLLDPPEEVVKEVARAPSLRSVREATVRLAKIKRQKDLEDSNKIITENRSTEFKAADGLGELKARIPMSAYFEMKRRCGDDYWEHESNIAEFLKNNPMYRVTIKRGTRGQEYCKGR